MEVEDIWLAVAVIVLIGFSFGIMYGVWSMNGY